MLVLAASGPIEVLFVLAYGSAGLELQHTGAEAGVGVEKNMEATIGFRVEMEERCFSFKGVVGCCPPNKHVKMSESHCRPLVGCHGSLGNSYPNTSATAAQPQPQQHCNRSRSRSVGSSRSRRSSRCCSGISICMYILFLFALSILRREGASECRSTKKKWGRFWMSRSRLCACDSPGHFNHEVDGCTTRKRHGGISRHSSGPSSGRVRVGLMGGSDYKTTPPPPPPPSPPNKSGLNKPGPS